MKARVSKKEVMNYFVCINTDGFFFHYLLHNLFDRTYYTAGVYGWNADVFVFDHVAIIQGFRPFGQICASRRLCKKYDDLAEKATRNIRMREDKRKKVLNLINQFCIEVKEEYEKNNN